MFSFFKNLFTKKEPSLIEDNKKTGSQLYANKTVNEKPENINVKDTESFKRLEKLTVVLKENKDILENLSEETYGIILKSVINLDKITAIYIKPTINTDNFYNNLFYKPFRLEFINDLFKNNNNDYLNLLLNKEIKIADEFLYHPTRSFPRIKKHFIRIETEDCFYVLSLKVDINLEIICDKYGYGEFFKSFPGDLIKVEQTYFNPKEENSLKNKQLNYFYQHLFETPKPAHYCFIDKSYENIINFLWPDIRFLTKDEVVKTLLFYKLKIEDDLAANDVRPSLKEYHNYISKFLDTVINLDSHSVSEEDLFFTDPQNGFYWFDPYKEEVIYLGEHYRGDLNYFFNDFREAKSINLTKTLTAQ